MKTYLVTGAAGFIGANFIKYLLNKKYVNENIKVIVLDALTYAGNLGTIKDDIDNERCIFVKGDIRDRELADKLFAENDIDYVVNFAAESHVDRSIEDPQLFLSVNILGTQNLMDAARRAWVTGKDAQGYPVWKEGKRYHQVSTDEVYGSLGAEGYFTELTPLYILQNLHPYVHIAHIRQVKRVLIFLCRLIKIPITCLLQLHDAQIITAHTIFRKS